MEVGRIHVMVKLALVTSLLICLGTAPAHSHSQPPQVLLRAAQCLAAKGFLPPSKATNLTFGYVLDEKSYPDDRVIYIVNYAAPTRSNGLVFAVFLTEHDGHQEFNVQNNASFVLSKEESSGVSFVNPALGGTWTQEHLASAIREIEKQPRFAIAIKDLSSVDTSASCESYTDPQRKGGEK
jgi:hypothetical protein